MRVQNFRTTRIHKNSWMMEEPFPSRNPNTPGPVRKLASPRPDFCSSARRRTIAPAPAAARRPGKAAGPPARSGSRRNTPRPHAPLPLLPHRLHQHDHQGDNDHDHSEHKRRISLSRTICSKISLCKPVANPLYLQHPFRAIPLRGNGLPAFYIKAVCFIRKTNSQRFRNSYGIMRRLRRSRPLFALCAAAFPVFHTDAWFLPAIR